MKKKKKKKKKCLNLRLDRALTFDCFRDKIDEGIAWFKAQQPEKSHLTSYDGLRLSAYLLPAQNG